MEPRLTDHRYVGERCDKCGTHVRKKSDRYCVTCAQRPTESLRRSKRDWHRNNYAHSKAIKLAWLKRNPGAVARRNIQYETSIKQQTPAWADLDSINSLYLEAQKLGLTVDHIYPLRGKTVSGLHVENNLRLVTHSENCSKSNKHPDDMQWRG